MFIKSQLADPWRNTRSYGRPTPDKELDNEYVVTWYKDQIKCYRLSTGALVPMNPLGSMFAKDLENVFSE